MLNKDIQIKSFLISFLIISSLNILAQKAAYDIKVKINGLRGSSCYLGNYYGNKEYIRDTAKINSNGEIEFKSKRKTDTLPKGMYFILTPDKKRYFEIIINKDMEFSIETDLSDFAKTIKFKGSEENTQYYEYVKFIEKTHTEKQIKDYQEKYIKEHPKTFLSRIFLIKKEIDIPDAPTLQNGKTDPTFRNRYYKKHYFDYIDFTDDRLLRTSNFQNKIDDYFSKQVSNNPDSIIKECDNLIEKTRPNKEMYRYFVWYLTRTYELSTIKGHDAIFVHMAKKYWNPVDAPWTSQSTLDALAKKVKQIEGKEEQKEIQQTEDKGDCNSITDIDGNIYRTVKIGTQCWMAENLKVTHYRNNDVLPKVDAGENWLVLETGAYCEFEDVKEYGRLYNWYAVNDKRNLCPVGWHVPSDEEWTTLTDFLGGESEAGGKMKENGTKHWKSPNEGATNSSGFTALPGGGRVNGGFFYGQDISGSWWTSTESFGLGAWCRVLNNVSSAVDRGKGKGAGKVLGFSVRCIRDK